MFSASASAMADLLPARNASGRDYCIGGCGADSREQPHFSDLHRKVVMIALEAEGTGHAAASGVEHRHARAGNFLEKPDCRRQRAGCFLVAVAVKNYGRG